MTPRKISMHVQLKKRWCGVSPASRKAWNFIATGVRNAKAARWNCSAHRVRKNESDAGRM